MSKTGLAFIDHCSKSELMGKNVEELKKVHSITEEEASILGDAITNFDLAVCDECKCIGDNIDDSRYAGSDYYFMDKSMANADEYDAWCLCDGCYSTLKKENKILNMDIELYDGFSFLDFNDIELYSEDDDNNGYLFGINIGSYQKEKEQYSKVDVEPVWFKDKKTRDFYVSLFLRELVFVGDEVYEKYSSKEAFVGIMKNPSSDSEEKLVIAENHRLRELGDDASNTFIFEGMSISDPYMDPTARFRVSPTEYYKKAYISWYKDLIVIKKEDNIHAEYL